MRALLLLVLLAIPSAAAVPNDPNLEDPADDQSPSGPANRWADLRRAWIEQAGEGFNITLEVASLSATDPAHYELLWLRSRDGNATGIGFSATQDGAGWRGQRLEAGTREVCSSRAQPLAPKSDAVVRIEAGTPGRLVWHANSTEMDARRGDVFYLFCAFSYVGSPLVGVFNADSARTQPSNLVNQSFHVGLADTVVVGDFDTHPDTLYLDDKDQGKPIGNPSFNITGFQLHVGDETVESTLRLERLLWSDLDTQDWHLNLILRRFDPYGGVEVGERLNAALGVHNGSLHYGVVRHDQQRAEGSSGRPGQLQVQLGSPGYARFTVPRDEWVIPTDLGGLTVFAFLTSMGTQDRPDVFSYWPERFFDVPTPWFVVVAAIASAIWARRRQG